MTVLGATARAEKRKWVDEREVHRARLVASGVSLILPLGATLGGACASQDTELVNAILVALFPGFFYGPSGPWRGPYAEDIVQALESLHEPPPLLSAALYIFYKYKRQLLVRRDDHNSWEDVHRNRELLTDNDIFPRQWRMIRAARLYALAILFCDDFLSIPQHTPGRIRRVFGMLSGLPLELKQIVCLRAIALGNYYIPTSIIDSAFSGM